MLRPRAVLCCAVRCCAPELCACCGCMMIVVLPHASVLLRPSHRCASPNSEHATSIHSFLGGDNVMPSSQACFCHPNHNSMATSAVWCFDADLTINSAPSCTSRQSSSQVLHATTTATSYKRCSHVFPGVLQQHASALPLSRAGGVLRAKLSTNTLSSQTLDRGVYGYRHIKLYLTLYTQPSMEGNNMTPIGMLRHS